MPNICSTLAHWISRSWGSRVERMIQRKVWQLSNKTQQGDTSKPTSHQANSCQPSLDKKKVRAMRKTQGEHIDANHHTHTDTKTCTWAKLTQCILYAVYCTLNTQMRLTKLVIVAQRLEATFYIHRRIFGSPMGGRCC